MDIKQLLRFSGKKKRGTRRLRPIKPSRRAELAYKAELVEIAKAIREVGERELIPVLQRLAPEYERQAAQDHIEDALGMVADGFGFDILQALDTMALQLGGISRMAMRLAMTAIERQRQETDKSLAAALTRAVGVDMTTAIKALGVNKQVEAAVAANAALITSLPDQAVEKIRGKVLAAVARGERFETLARDIREQFGATESRAKLIARDQMAKVNSSITEAKQKALGIKKYEWSTAGDERVRDSHRENNGKTFAWDKPPATGHPGEDYQCRCVAIPIIEFDDE